jgi:hypothetical protein
LNPELVIPPKYAKREPALRKKKGRPGRGRQGVRRRRYCGKQRRNGRGEEANGRGELWDEWHEYWLRAVVQVEVPTSA